MRRSWLTICAVAAVLIAASGKAMVAQADGAPRQGRRGGFGGGQPVQGIVTAASSDKLTLKTDAGDSYEVTVTDTTRVMKSGQQIKLSDVKPGDSVTAMGQVDATKKTVQAMMVNDVDAATVAKAKENMGKTYITGKITAIDADNLKLTVMRTDSVSQVIAVDDGTSFQRGTRGVTADVVAAGGLAGFGGGMRMGGGGGRGGNAQGTPPAPESITLADIKVGDSLIATGVMKGGAFTALKMGVSEPGMQGPGGGRNGGPPGGAPPVAGGPSGSPTSGSPPSSAPPQ